MTRSPALPALLSAAVAVVLYAVTLAGTYVYDDVPIVRDDARVRNPSQWRQLWTEDYAGGATDRLYRPLVSTSYAVEWRLHGDRPWAFHLVNVLLNAAVAAAVAELTRRCASGAAAVAAGTLFAAMPVHAEAVANIVGRAELAAAAGLVGSLVVLARRPLTPGRAAAACARGVVARLSKEQGRLAPLLWLVFLRLMPPAGPGDKAERRVLLIAGTYGWAGYILVRQFVLGLRFDWDRTGLDPFVQPLVRSVGLDRLLVPVAVLGRYAALVAWPAHTSPDYGAGVIGSVAHADDPYLWAGFAVAAGWAVAVAIAWRRRAGFVLFSLLAAAVAYGLIGNVVALIGTIFGERLIYLPTAFVAVLAGVALARVPRTPRWGLLAVAVLAGGVQTARWASRWNVPLDLYRAGYAAEPRSAQLHFLLAPELRRAGYDRTADRLLAEATDLYPRYWQAWMYRAVGSAESGDFAAADAQLARGLKLSASPALIGARDRIADLRRAATQPASGR